MCETVVLSICCLPRSRSLHLSSWKPTRHRGGDSVATAVYCTPFPHSVTRCPISYGGHKYAHFITLLNEKEEKEEDGERNDPEFRQSQEKEEEKSRCFEFKTRTHSTVHMFAGWLRKTKVIIP